MNFISITILVIILIDSLFIPQKTGLLTIFSIITFVFLFIFKKLNHRDLFLMSAELLISCTVLFMLDNYIFRDSLDKIGDWIFVLLMTANVFIIIKLYLIK